MDLLSINRAGWLTPALVLSIFLLITLTSEFTSAKSNHQLTVTLTNTINDSYSTKKVPLPPPTGASDIAIQFLQEIKEMERKQSLDHYHHKTKNLKTRQLEYYKIGQDDTVEVLMDALKNDTSTNTSEPSAVETKLNLIKSEAKATDYIFTSPISTRHGKSDKYFSDGNGHYEESGKEPEEGSSTNQGVLAMLDTKSPSPMLPTFIINQPLHSKNRPQVTFEVTSDKVMFVFEVSPEESAKSFISVVVEKMTCRENERNETGKPKLHIRGQDQEWSFNKDFDNSLNNFQSVDYMISGDKIVSIWGSEDWTNSSAVLVASIYTETSSCHFCPLTHFCCGRRESACKYSAMANGNVRESSKFINREHYKSLQQLQQQQRYRCVPKIDENGQSLMCNSHPNCGFHCNADELSINCPKDDADDNGDDNCSGQNCRESEQDRFMITLLLLILFCVFVPLCIFLFCCSRKELRREFGRARGRCPLPLEIVFCPFSMNADDPPGSTSTTANLGGTPLTEAESRLRGNARRNFRRSEEVNSGRGVPSGLENPGFFEDLPPPYSECCNDKTTFPNPGPECSTSSNNEAPGTSTFSLEPIITSMPLANRINGRAVGVLSSQTMTTSLSLPSTPTRMNNLAVPSLPNNETSQQ